MGSLPHCKKTNKQTKQRQNLKQRLESIGFEGAFLFDADSELVAGDLAIQVHCGQGVTKRDLGWHYDALNSLFHVAVTIHGERNLHSCVEDAPGFRDSQCAPWVQKLKPGDVYISSPCFFRHAVEFSERGWGERSIAIQARFLFTNDEYQRLHSLMKTDGMRDQVARLVADAIIDGFKCPSLAETLAAQADLSDPLAPFDISSNYIQMHDALCDVCDHQIEGIRWKCTQCPNYDQCNKCRTSEGASHGPGHAFSMVKGGTSQVY